MASFVADLWESIFTPGPTPSILKATNISFACLQVLFLGLLVATYSIHFVILSFLCGGLWWAINWFAAELKASQEREEREKAKAARAPKPAATKTDESSSEDTEVEATTTLVGGGGGSAAVAAGETIPSKEVEPLDKKGELKHRSAAMQLSPPETQSSASTEDEWERVSENENEKDK